jgi:hypothetical protein
MTENPYTPPSTVNSDDRLARTIGTIPALIGVYFLVQIFAVVVSPGGDPYSILLLQVPAGILALACFVLGRYSRGRAKPPQQT